MDYKQMTDCELAKIMVNYINRIDHLRHMIGNYLNNKTHNYIQAEQIKNDYRRIKYELQEDAHYLDLVRNRNGSVVYMGFFSPSIREASAWGFTVSVNAAVTQDMYDAVEEAHYKLTKYYTLEEWGDLV